MAQGLNALIPLQVQGPDFANSLASGVEIGNALLDAPIKRKLMEAQAQYYGSPEARASVYGTPIPYDRGDGTLGLGVITKDGQFQDVPTPGAYRPSNLMTDDLGYGVVTRDARTAAPVGPVMRKTGNPPTGFVPGKGGGQGAYMPGTQEAFEAEKPAKARGIVDTVLDDLETYYADLDAKGGAIDPSKSAIENIGARAGSSSIGQAVGGYLGTETQTIRDKINTLRPALINAIRQATGMSAKAMDSNVELQFYLQQATDPTLGKQANAAALASLRRLYGNANPGPGGELGIGGQVMPGAPAQPQSRGPLPFEPDPNKRVVGQVYIANGKQYLWAQDNAGVGWEPLD